MFLRLLIFLSIFNFSCFSLEDYEFIKIRPSDFQNDTFYLKLNISYLGNFIFVKDPLSKYSDRTYTFKKTNYSQPLYHNISYEFFEFERNNIQEVQTFTINKPTGDTYYDEGSNSVIGDEVMYYLFNAELYELINTCYNNEFHNTETGNCQSCQQGQSWSYSKNSCYVDCTDLNKNKWGFSDGSCVDCSNLKSDNEIRECYCNSFGSGVDYGVSISTDNIFYSGKCKNGNEFKYKRIPVDVDFKPNSSPSNPLSNNNTDNSYESESSSNNSNTSSNKGISVSSGGGSSGGGSSGSGSIISIPYSPKKDNDNKNKENISENPKLTQPTENNSKNSKTSGNGNGLGDGKGKGVGGGEGNGTGNGFGEGDGKGYGNPEKQHSNFGNTIKNTLYKTIENFSQYKDEVSNLIDKLNNPRDFEIIKLTRSTSCPVSFNVPIGSFTKVIKIDICNILSDSYQILYYFFFILFSISFAIGVFKIFVLLI